MSQTPTVNPQCPNCAEWARKFAQLEARVRDLEARLKQNSSNSSKPPSTDPPWLRPPPPPPSGRAPGGQPGHAGHHRIRLPPERVTAIVPHVPPQCERCGRALPPMAGPHDTAPTWHQVLELPLHPVEVTEHQGHARHCAHCGHVTLADIPAQVRAHCLGPRLSAAVSYLSARCHCSKRPIREALEVLLGVPIALGTVCLCEAEMSGALVAAHAEVARDVRAAPALNVDETGWSERGRLCWLWLAASARTVLFQIGPTRAVAGLRALLGAQPQNFVTSDRWQAYNCLALTQRQLCWAHLERDFQALVERGAGCAELGVAGLHAWARVLVAWRDFKAGRLDRRALEAQLEPVRQGLREDLERARDGPAGRVSRFAGRILKLEPALWTFARTDGVEPTNNHAERQLRPGVLWRKRSFGCQSERGCRFVERMLSVVQTLLLRQRPVLDYLTAALTAHRHRLPAPRLCS